MDKNEVALQLTLKALELGHISYRRIPSIDRPKAERSDANMENSELIADFYNNILKRISQSAKSPDTELKKSSNS